jgi:hypothetical protein
MATLPERLALLTFLVRFMLLNLLFTENKRLSNTTTTKTVSEARRSGRVAVQTGQAMTYKTLHRK